MAAPSGLFERYQWQFIEAGLNAKLWQSDRRSLSLDIGYAHIYDVELDLECIDGADEVAASTITLIFLRTDASTTKEAGLGPESMMATLMGTVRVGEVDQ